MRKGEQIGIYLSNEVHQLIKEIMDSKLGYSCRSKLIDDAIKTLYKKMKEDGNL